MRRLLFVISLLYPASLMAVTHYGWAPASGWVIPRTATSAAWKANTQYRIEARINCSTSGNGGYILGVDGMNVQLSCTGGPYITGNLYDSGMGAGAPIPSGTGVADLVARFSRLNGGNEYCVEVWRMDNGAYSETCSQGTGQGAIDLTRYNIGVGFSYSGALTGGIDFIRWYSTTVPMGTIPSTAPGGDMADWEFENNLNDSSSNGLTLTGGGSGGSYVATNTYGPLVVFPSLSNCYNNYPTVGLNGNPPNPATASPAPQFCVYPQPGGSAIPLKTVAYSPNQGDSLTYSWSQADGPTTGTITSPTSQNTAATGLSQFGQYDFVLTATDQESNHNTGTLTLGIVTVGNSAAHNCIVSNVPTNLQYLIGPLTPWGAGDPCSPWRWYDITEIADVNSTIAVYHGPSYGLTANPGTISINTGTGAITGTGTHFTTDCTNTTTKYDTASGSGFSNSSPPSCDNVNIWVWWNADGATGTGRAPLQIHVINDTSAQLENGYSILFPTSTGTSNLQYSVYSYAEMSIGFANIGQTSYNWNYYDNVIGLYRLYYRTGITYYLTFARKLAEDWWTYNLDHGYSPWSDPRAIAIPGMMARTIEGGITARWAGIENKVGSGPQGSPCESQSCGGYSDIRGTGYATSYLGIITSVDPTITGSKLTAYCNAIAGTIDSFWTQYFAAPGAGGVPATYSFLGNASYPDIGPSTLVYTYNILAAGLRDTYRAALGPCNDATTASNAKNLLLTLEPYIYEAGQVGTRSIPIGNGGGTGRAGTATLIGKNMLSSGEQAIYSCMGQGYGVGPGGLNPGNNVTAPTGCIQGTVTGTAGSNQLTGHGTHFTTQFKCNGTDGVGIVLSPASYPNCSSDGFTECGANWGLETHVVQSCADDTHMTLADNLQYTIPYGGSVLSQTETQGLPIHETPLDSGTGATCQPMPASLYCFPTYPDADYGIDALGMFGWTYDLTHQINYRIWGDDVMSFEYGGTAYGPGSYVGAAFGQPSGPFSSGQSSGGYSYTNALGSCNLQAEPPCAPGGPGISYNDAYVGNHPEQWGKWYGEGSGWIGAADNYLAYRLMVPGQN